MKDKSAGLLAAIFIGIAPGYISRSVAGSYDNEAIAIFLLMFTFYLWIKAMKDGSAFYGMLAGVFYFYMVAAWGGYVFITNMIPLHALVLTLMGRFNNKLYVGYSSWYVIGTLASMQVPFVGFQPVKTSEHMGALGTLSPPFPVSPTNSPWQASSVSSNSSPSLNSSAPTSHPSNSESSSAQSSSSPVSQA